jgi:hypothetical protein
MRGFRLELKYVIPIGIWNALPYITRSEIYIRTHMYYRTAISAIVISNGEHVLLHVSKEKALYGHFKLRVRG